MDTFQGWYKDGREGTRDCRFTSGFYFLLRISLGCEIMMMVSMDYHNRHNLWLWEMPIPGITHFMLGVFFFAVKPYKRVYMNHMDGLTFTLFGGLYFVVAYNIRALYILGAVVGSIMAVFVLAYSTYMCIKQRKFSNF